MTPRSLRVDRARCYREPMVATFGFLDSPVAVRTDIRDAHRRTWERLAAAGTWWTGAERVAIGREVRLATACDLCARRKAALSPMAVKGAHTDGGTLPAAAIEAVHRLITDSGRLSRQWYEGLLADGLTDVLYVELVGVVTQLFSVDEFHRAIGASTEPLPTPEAGEPGRRRPEVVDGGAWLPMVNTQNNSKKTLVVLLGLIICLCLCLNCVAAPLIIEHL